MKIGLRIKERRKELKMSADELGKRLGKDRSTVYRYENGDIENLPLDILEPIAQVLQTTPAYLMGWTSNPTNSDIKDTIPPISPSVFECTTNDEKKLLRSYRTLSEISKKRVLSYCEGIAEIERADLELTASHK